MHIQGTMYDSFGERLEEQDIQLKAVKCNYFGLKMAPSLPGFGTLGKLLGFFLHQYPHL